MCTFGNRIQKKSVIGYKVAIQVDKHYYSPVTGIRYEKGSVPVPRAYGKYNQRENLKFEDVLDPHEGSHNLKYIGNTAVFCQLINAINFKSTMHSNDINFVILEIKLGGKLYTGTYTSNVYIGNEILSVKKIKI